MKKFTTRRAFAAAALVGAGVTLLTAVAPQRSARASSLPGPAVWMPASAKMVIYLDWSALLSSPSVRGLDHAFAQQDSWPELQEFRELTSMDPWQDIWAFSLFTSRRENETSNWGLAIYGAFDPERVVESMESQRHIERSEYRETTLYGVSALGPRFGEEPQAIAFPDATTALFGPASQVHAMLDTGYGFEPSVAYGELEHWVDKLSMGETFWVVGTGAAGLPRRPVESVLSSDLPSLSSFAISIRFGSYVAVKAQGEASSAEAANKLADVARGMKALSSFQQEPNEMLQAIAESLEIQTLDETIEVSFEVDGKSIRDLLRQKTGTEGSGSAFVRP